MEFKTENGVLVRGSKGPEETRVVIPDTVSVIGEGAFLEWFPRPGLKRITELVIPEGVREIKQKAFINACSLESLTLPSSLKRIGSEAFLNCGLPEELVIPGNVERVGENAFANEMPRSMDRLKTLTVESGVKILGLYSFSNQKNLTSVTLPEDIFIESTTDTDYMYDVMEDWYRQRCVFRADHNIRDITVPGKMKAHGIFDTRKFAWGIGHYIMNVLPHVRDRDYSYELKEPDIEAPLITGCYKAERHPVTEDMLLKYFDSAFKAALASDDTEGIQAMTQSDRLFTAENIDSCLEAAEKQGKSVIFGLLEEHKSKLAGK